MFRPLATLALLAPAVLGQGTPVTLGTWTTSSMSWSLGGTWGWCAAPVSGDVVTINAPASGTGTRSLLVTGQDNRARGIVLNSPLVRITFDTNVASGIYFASGAGGSDGCTDAPVTAPPVPPPPPGVVPLAPGQTYAPTPATVGSSGGSDDADDGGVPIIPIVIVVVALPFLVVALAFFLCPGASWLVALCGICGCKDKCLSDDGNESGRKQGVDNPTYEQPGAKKDGFGFAAAENTTGYMEVDGTAVKKPQK